MKLILYKKTGFKNLTNYNDIIINDFKGQEFYNNTDVKKPVKKFNLPPGIYTLISGSISKLEKPVNYKLSKLPFPERNYKPPFNFKIVVANNPNKCTIDWINKTITFDYSIMKLGLPVIFYILFHEYGHSLYGTEKYADLVASNLMLKRGYNPSQIGKAQLTSLSSYQFERKHFLINKILSR